MVFKIGIANDWKLEIKTIPLLKRLFILKKKRNKN